jgi:hypothetical protein
MLPKTGIETRPVVKSPGAECNIRGYLDLFPLGDRLVAAPVSVLWT